jgi:hypothetical protein
MGKVACGIAALACALGCGSSGEPTGPAVASEAGRSARAGSAGSAGEAGSGASAGLSSSGSSGRGGSAGAVAGAGGDPGMDPAAGAGGDSLGGGEGGSPPSVAGGEAGVGESGDGGRESGGVGGEGGGGGAVVGPQCDCDATEECVNRKCVKLAACDCAAFDVECAPLRSALKAAYACPVEVHCGACDEGELCEGYGDPNPTARKCWPTELSCVTVEEFRQMGYQQQVPTCPVPGFDAECSEPYALCSTPVYLETTGVECPTPGNEAGIHWRCGPAQ